MKLKKYQKNTLAAVREYFAECQFRKPDDAYREVTAKGDARLRLGADWGYKSPKGMEATPTVCIKVPTGGGKTILAAHSLKIIAETLSRDYPLVVWFAPSDTIRRQTADALKRTTHPYRVELDAQFGGRVKVFDLDEKFQILPDDIENNLCIVVSTTQAFVHAETNKYNVYKHNENLEPHFAAIPLEPGMEVQDEEGGPASVTAADATERVPPKPKFSFVNLVAHHRPIVVVDEAHHMVTELSAKALARINPSAVLGLTATPGRDNNVLYSVYAQELFDEEMVKLPIELTEWKNNWEEAVAAAIAKRRHLAELASADCEPYLRPIVLFQATAKNGDVPVEKLKAHLVETLKIPESEIRIATGDQKELDDVNVADPACKVNYIITVQALKEGWDCPFAYVFCSVANVGSSKDTIQLLGRVMRQPYAKRRRTRELNRAYAFVTSGEFGTAAHELTEGLRQKGFAETEAFAAIQENLPTLGPDDELFSTPPDVVKIDKDILDDIVLPDGISRRDFASGDGEINLTGQESDEIVESVAKQLSDKGHAEKAHELTLKFRRKKAESAAEIPAKTKHWRFPRLCARMDGLDLFSADEAFETIGDSIAEHLPKVLADSAVSLQPGAGKTFVLKLDGNEMVSTFKSETETAYLKGFSGEINAGDVVNCLDALIRNAEMLSQAEKRHWLAGVVAGLAANQRISYEQMVLIRHQLKQKLEDCIVKAFETARSKAYQEVFFGKELALDLPGGFAFDEAIYDGNMDVYRGRWRFAKHFLGPYRIPSFDGKKLNGEGEEFECAKQIDMNANVVAWLRNRVGDARSFRLPMGGATNWFYPDFIGELADGRLFVIEYKGALTGQTADTVEKTAVGQLWAKQDPGKYVYATIYGDSPEGKSVAEQIVAAFVASCDGRKDAGRQ